MAGDKGARAPLGRGEESSLGRTASAGARKRRRDRRGGCQGLGARLVRESPDPVGPGSSRAHRDQGTPGWSFSLIFIFRFLLP